MENLPEFPVYGALTMPAINRYGIPHKASLLIMMAVSAFWAKIGPPYGIVAGGIMYVIIRALTEWDPNFARQIDIWAITKAKALFSGGFGGSLLSALPTGVPDDAEDIAGGA